MTATLVAVNAGLSEPSSTRMLVDRLVESTVAHSSARGAQVDVETIDLRDLAVDIGASMAAGFATGSVRAAIAAVENADALIVATPVFNASYSGLFKAFFDLVDVEKMSGTPVLIGATGGSPRHSMVLDHALRPLFSYLRAVVVPTGVYAAAEDWAGTSGDTATLASRIERAAGELVALGLGPVDREGTAGREAVSSAPSGATDFGATDFGAADIEAGGIATFARLLGATDSGRR